ncbi:MAG: thioredoxin [Stappiaceae bacterium]
MSGPSFTFGGAGGSYTGSATSDAEPQMATSGGDDLIKDISTADFQKDVLEASQTVPVLVDFWAPWCGPCKQLTPVIEKAVKAARGAVKLAKMNIDDHPEIPGQMGVQSIPAVVAFKDGRPLDGFMGAQTESQVQAFIEKIAGPIGPSEVDQLIEAADAARIEKDFGQAAQLYAGALAQDNANAAAIAGLAQCYVGAGDLERAREALEAVPADQQNNPEVVAAKAAIDLADQASAVGDLAELQQRIAKDEGNLQARLDLALALSANGDNQAAVDQLLEIVSRDRDWQDDAGRKQLLQFFEAWGFKDPASIYGRRKLSAVLFS